MEDSEGKMEKNIIEVDVNGLLDIAIVLLRGLKEILLTPPPKKSVAEMLLER